MKKITFTSIFILIAFLAIAQSPFYFNYQAAVRDNQNQILANQNVALKFSILENSDSGTVMYSETHTVQSSALGIVNLQIGKGQNQTGSLSALDWKNKHYWLKVEMDDTVGTNYQLMGITQLVSVPYALHAETATNVDDADANPQNELQTLSFNSSNNELSISSGNTVTIPTGGTDADADPNNEIQTLSKSANKISLSKNGGTVTDEVDDADADPANELQTLSINGDDLTISEGNTISLAKISSPWKKNGEDVYRNTGNVGIGTSTPEPSSKLEIVSTDKGILIPRMTEAQRNAISSPAEGLLIYQKDNDKGFYFYTGSTWKIIGFEVISIDDLKDAKSDPATGYNVFLGEGSGKSNTGSHNTATGYRALFNNSTGVHNSAFGRSSLYSNINGEYNNAFGNYALQGNKNGKNNTALGYSALNKNSSGSGATAIGYYAMYYANNTTTAFENNNVAIGNNTLRGSTTPANNTGNNNTAVGREALMINSYGHENSAYGYRSMYSNVNGAYNSAFGYETLFNNFDGGSNSAFGYKSLYDNTGAFNSAYGSGSLSKNTSGSQNSAFGKGSLYYNTTGSNNTAIGYEAGAKALGSNNIFIGHQAGLNETGDNKLYIDNSDTNAPLIKGDFDNDKLEVNGTMEVKSQIKISSGTDNPEAGMVRWNSSTNDFEGYTGTEWLSLTGHTQWGEINNSNYENSKIIANDGDEDDRFGNSVSIDGNYAIIGASNSIISGKTSQGSAYIFHRDGNTWSQQTKLIASEGNFHHYFGCSVSINGDYAIIGASGHGSAYIFHREDTNWTQQAKLTASDGDVSDKFGIAVSINGDYAIIGANEDNISGNHDQGSAYIFQRKGKKWIQQAKITANDGEAGDEFGFSVSISGDYAIIGAYKDDISGNTDQGSAYIFHRDGANWIQQSKFIAIDEDANDWFGKSVSINGDYFVIGASTDDISGNACQGSVYIFHRAGTNWEIQAKLTDSYGASFDHFGNSVSINGDYVVIGAYKDDISGNHDQGSAYIFYRSGTIWSQQAKLTASDGDAGDYFGNSVSISGDYAIIGANWDNISGNYNQGSGYIFNK